MKENDTKQQELMFEPQKENEISLYQKIDRKQQEIKFYAQKAKMWITEIDINGEYIENLIKSLEKKDIESVLNLGLLKNFKETLSDNKKKEWLKKKHVEKVFKLDNGIESKLNENERMYEINMFNVLINNCRVGNEYNYIIIPSVSKKIDSFIKEVNNVLKNDGVNGLDINISINEKIVMSIEGEEREYVLKIGELILDYIQTPEIFNNDKDEYIINSLIENIEKVKEKFWMDKNIKAKFQKENDNVSVKIKKF